MTFQSGALTMVSLGVDEQVQPRQEFPTLGNGNHLRWSFEPTVGFARHGYYLFRREHIGSELQPHRLSDDLGGVTPGTESLPLSVGTVAGPIRFNGPSSVTLTDDFDLGPGTGFSPGSDGTVELEYPSDPLRISFPSQAFAVTLLLDARNSTHVTAFAEVNGDHITVDETRMSGSGTVTVSFDAIDGLELHGTGTLVDLHYNLVTDQYHEGWKPVPNTDQPFTLPLEHPDYPVTGGGNEDLDAARHEAESRIRYGDPADYVAPGGTVQSAQAAVTNGSSLVTTSGSGTWQPAVVGNAFRMDGDDTAYVVVERVTDDRIALGRPYEGASRTDTYEVTEDEFAHLHESLAALVDRGPSNGGMSGRVSPQSVADEGFALYWPGFETVLGWGANWTSDLEGLQFYPALTSQGTVSATKGNSEVQRDAGSVPDPAWDERVIGGTLRIDSQRTEYTIVDVNGARLELDRSYAGPDISGSTFTILSETSYEVDAVVGPNKLRLASPYRGQYTSSDYAVSASVGSTSPDGPRFPRQHPLDAVLLATLSPAFAQALGLYWNDETAAPDQAYDYLIVADHDRRVARHYHPDKPFDPQNAELFGPGGGKGDADGYITFDVRRDRQEPLRPPETPAAYELPERPPSDQVTERNVAGIGWEHETSPGGRTRPGRPVYYHLWRHEYSTGEPEDEPLDPAEYSPVTSLPGTSTGRNPILVGSERRHTPDGWPEAPVLAIDPGLADGWYGYRINGVDLFGRASELSEPASWYDLDGTTERHPVAIELRDDTPPPPPRNVLADHASITSIPDAGNGEMTVRWLWPAAFARQAPDTTEFHIYYHPGGFADQRGTITSVTSNSADVYTVETDIDPIDQSGEVASGEGYAGATLHVDGETYEVIDSQAGTGGTGLELTVGDRRARAPATLPTEDGPVPVAESDSRPHVVEATNLPRDERIPPTNADCTVSVPPAYRKGTVTVTDGTTDVTGLDTAWTPPLEGQSFTTPDGDTYEVASVIDGTHLTLDRPYDIKTKGTSKRGGLAYVIDHPIKRDASDSAVWQRPSNPSDWEATWATVALGDGTQVDPSGTPVADRQFPAEDEPYRLYEETVPVPAASDPTADPFVPTAEQPVVYANVGVSAVDDDGNESPVSGPVQIARAKTDPPPAPEPPTYENEIDWATPPEYDGRAHYTVRWRHPEEACRTHVYRVMDKALFKQDWQRRRDGAQQDVTTAEADKPFFPAYRRDDDTRRGQIVDALDALHTAVTDESDFEVAFQEYTGLDPDVKQVLATLPDNRPAYQQITMKALAAGDEAARNRAGPDLELGESYPTGSRWCAYVDSFDGRSRRQYFYRTGTVDAAGNRSEQWSDPTQPVQAVDTVAPTAPSPNAIEAGHHQQAEPDDRAITLRWDPSPGSETSEYRIYWTADESASRDVRAMEEVATVSQTGSDPLVWSDTGREPGLTHHYRVTAVDAAGNESAASPVLSSGTFVLEPPSPPSLSLTWVQVDEQSTVHPLSASPPQDETWWPAVKVAWSESGSRLRALVQHRIGTSGTFESVSGWLSPETTEFVHEVSTDTVAHEYRLRVQNEIGATNETFAPATLAANTEA